MGDVAKYFLLLVLTSVFLFVNGCSSQKETSTFDITAEQFQSEFTRIIVADGFGSYEIYDNMIVNNDTGFSVTYYDNTTITCVIDKETNKISSISLNSRAEKPNIPFEHGNIYTALIGVVQPQLNLEERSKFHEDIQKAAVASGVGKGKIEKENVSFTIEYIADTNSLAATIIPN